MRAPSVLFLSSPHHPALLLHSLFSTPITSITSPLSSLPSPSPSPSPPSSSSSSSSPAAAAATAAFFQCRRRPSLSSPSCPQRARNARMRGAAVLTASRRRNFASAAATAAANGGDEGEGGEGKKGEDEEDLSSLRWPSDKKKNKKQGGVTVPPTPYEIFGQRERSAYSKRRFCALVKLYHPDRHCQHGGDAELARLSRATKLERYRLVVAANALLSDPVKKAAYDQYGIGWASSNSSSSSSSSHYPGQSEREIFRYGFYHYRHHFHHHYDHHHHHHHHHGHYGEYSGARGHWSSRASSSDDYSARMNATWEDWEKWYRQRQRQQRGARPEQHEQQPLFAENGTFAAVVVALALLGGVVETMRAHSFAATLSQQRELLHSAVARERELRNAAGVAGAKNDRIQAFLRAREPPVGGGGAGAGAAVADSSLTEERDWKKPPPSPPTPSLPPSP